MKNILFSFQGRISRKQFFLGILFMMVQSLVLLFLLSMTFDLETNTPSTAGIILFIAVLILNLWQSFALYVKRFHDRNKSAWWMLIGLVPVVGSLWILIECGFLAGDKGDNQFGKNPKLS